MHPNMPNLLDLDQATTAVVQQAWRAVPSIDWQRVMARIRIAPLGNVSSIDFSFQMADGRTGTGIEPVLEEERRLDDAAYAHWRLTQDLGQPRWYMMTVQLDRSGRYSVEFEYRDYYKEGDIMKSLD